MQALVPRQGQQAPAGYVSALAFGISLGANVVLLAGLIGVLAVLLLGNAGAFAARGASGQSGPGGSVRGGTLSSPAATATPLPSPTATTAPVSWLQVTPSSVQLGCGESQLAQVVLQNNGPQTLDWQVMFPLPVGQAVVAVDPQQGELAAGESTQVLLQNMTQANGQQGVIDFAPMTPGAGPPATVSYTTVGC
jgi:hypothetical protein